MDRQDPQSSDTPASSANLARMIVRRSPGVWPRRASPTTSGGIVKTNTERDGAQRLMTARQAAAYLAISERHLWTITRGGGLRSIKLGRAVRYDMAEVDRYIASRQMGQEGS